MTLPVLAEDAMPMATTAEWELSNGSITLGAEGTTLLYTPEQNKSVTTNGYTMQYVDVNRIDVLAGSHNIVEVNEGGNEGYGVLGNGNTVITVDGTLADGSVPMISDTSLRLEGFLRIRELNIAGRAVVTLSPDMFMNGDMDHDLAGKEGLEKSDGVVVSGCINLGQGSLILDNGSGYLFDNGYYDPTKTDGAHVGDAVSNNVGYTLNVTHDEAYLQIGTNMRSRWALINGMDSDGALHDLSIGGYARETNITELRDMKNLTLSGGQFNIDKATGSIHGDLTIAYGATVILSGGVDNNNVMAEGSGVLSVDGLFDIGGTTQTFTASNSIDLNNAIIESRGGTGTLVIAGAVGGGNTVEMTFGGMHNIVSTDLRVNAGMTLALSSDQQDGNVRDMFVHTGVLSGGGNLAITGSGVVDLVGDNREFTGNIRVNGGATLTVGHQHAVAHASAVSIGSGSNMFFDNPDFPVEFVELRLGDGSTLAIEGLSTTLTYDSSQSALSAEKLTFDAGGALNIVFNDEIAPMRVYNLFHTENDISEFGQLSLHLYMKDGAGQHEQFDQKHYVTGYRQLQDGTYLFYVGTRFGNIWSAAEANWSSSVWNSYTSGELASYDASSFDYSLFLNQAGVAESTVHINEQVNTRGIYIDSIADEVGHTDYTFVGEVDGIDIAGGTQIHMRDDAEGRGAADASLRGTATFVNVQGGSTDNPLGWVTVSTGTIALTQGSEFCYSAADMLQVAAYGTAEVTVDASSRLKAQSGATFTATTGTVASIAGVKMTGDAILGGNSVASRNISVMENACLDGFYVEAIELRGTGSLTNGGIGADTGLSTDTNGVTSVGEGAYYSLGGSLSFSQTLVNYGTVSIANNATFEFGALTGSGSVYTFISGGTVEGWSNLNSSDFMFNGVRVSDILTGATFRNMGNGQISLSFSGIKAIHWDDAWGVSSAPAFGKTYTGNSSSNANLFSALAEQSYAYDYGKIVNGGGGNTVVVIQGGGSTSTSLYLAGGATRGTYNGTHHHWVIDEGSDYAFKIGGMMYTDWQGNPLSAANATINGDSHLQIDGAGSRTDVEVYGGSWGVTQTGDAYLSINAGGYQNIYGGSRDVALNGSVVMDLNGGQLNTYYSGKVFDSAGGWTSEGGNTEFIYNSYADAAWALGGYYDPSGYNAERVPVHYALPAGSVAHWGGIYATGSNWGTASGAATAVLGDADIYLSSKFNFSTNLAVIDGGGDNVSGLSTLHFTDGVYYENLNQDDAYVWIQAADSRYVFLDQWSATNQKGTQPFIGKFTSIEIRGFDRFELADGAKLVLQSSRFNTDRDITVSGAGIVELVCPEVFQLNYYGIALSPFCEKDSEQGRSIAIPRRNITLENGARLMVSTDAITAWNANSGWAQIAEDKSEAEQLAMSKNWSAYYNPSDNGRSDITVNSGTTLEITHWLSEGQGGSMLVDLFLSGHGTDGLGALYKGVSESDKDSAAFYQFPYIELKDDASIGIDAGASPIYMYGADNVYDNALNSTTGLYEKSDYLGDYNQSTLKLNSHTLTITGGGTLVMVNTTIPEEVGGTLYVQEGTLSTVNTSDHRLQMLPEEQANDARHVTIARTTDIVLSDRGLLHTDLNNGSDDLTHPLGSGLQALKFASLTGEGETNLEDFGLNGIEVIVVRDQFYGEYMDSSRTYWNENGYGYAVYSGAILGDGDSSVTKSGKGVQYFSGSESTYGYTLDSTRLGGTYVSNGILYALGTSSFHKVDADSFVDGMTKTSMGVFGAGDVYWTSYMLGEELQEGRVYLSDGVRIVNPGSYYLNPNMPEDMQPAEKNMIIGVEAAPNGTSLRECVDGKYTFLINQTEVINLAGVDYVRVDVHNLSAINGMNGIYADGATYTAGELIDRNKMLLITKADWDSLSDNDESVTVTGLGTAGYNEATWSGLLRDVEGCTPNLVKEGAGTLVLDQITTYGGNTRLEGGTLSLKGWVDPNTIAEEGKFLMVEGSSLKLSFDGTYTDGGMDVEHYAATGEIVMLGEVNEDTELSANLTLVGRGDVRWNAESGWTPSWEDGGADESFTDGETAALISDVGAGVDFTISGLLSGEGNLLHSGNGTLTLTNANTYSGGTVITRSHVYVGHDTALGDTAGGGVSARLVTWRNSHLHITDGVHVTVAAPTSNAIEGSVYIGESIEAPQATQLTMTGNGYWAEHTYVENWNSVLLFSGAGASNIGDDEVAGNGAGILYGQGTVAASDADHSGELQTAFNSMQNFSGSVVVEGAGSSLSITESESPYSYNVSSGVSDSAGQVTVTGKYAHFNAPKADITVMAGSSMNLTSSGYTEYREEGSSEEYANRQAATVTAGTVTIAEGASLNVSYGEESLQFNNLQKLHEDSTYTPDELLGYGYERGTQFAMDGATGYDYHYNEAVALNQTAAGATNVTNLVLKGGSTYSPSMANTSLCGGTLTLDVAAGLIKLDITLDGEWKSDGSRQQIVLFTGVDSINFIGVGAADTFAIAHTNINNVYYTMAQDYFDSAYVNEVTYLVWDASDGIVYLDYAVPEPTTATLSLLALAALAVRRRRK